MNHLCHKRVSFLSVYEQQEHSNAVSLYPKRGGDCQLSSLRNPGSPALRIGWMVTSPIQKERGTCCTSRCRLIECFYGSKNRFLKAATSRDSFLLRFGSV